MTTTQPSPPTSYHRHHQHSRHPYAASTTTDTPTPPPPTSPSRHHITTTTTSPHKKGASVIIPARDTHRIPVGCGWSTFLSWLIARDSVEISTLVLYSKGVIIELCVLRSPFDVLIVFLLSKGDDTFWFGSKTFGMDEFYGLFGLQEFLSCSYSSEANGINSNPKFGIGGVFVLLLVLPFSWVETLYCLCTSGFHGVNEPGGVRYAREDDHEDTEGREDVYEVFQQRGSYLDVDDSNGSMIDLGCARRANDFVVKYDARSKDLEACLEKGRRIEHEAESMDEVIYGVVWFQGRVPFGKGKMWLLNRGEWVSYWLLKKAYTIKYSIHPGADALLVSVLGTVEFVDREVKSLKRSKIVLVQFHWNSKRGPEFTWERKDQIRSKCPQLFVDSFAVLSFCVVLHPKHTLVGTGNQSIGCGHLNEIGLMVKLVEFISFTFE
ncbi:hypothetical protein Tco_0839200 [Tanacetum coccineum]|uniref:Reverse transcriptase domain-containing protein n=1 Tax=Tanacetum coccineum TaxID=301880 RepID=A0ABQ5ATY5_9ASTR